MVNHDPNDKACLHIDSPVGCGSGMVVGRLLQGAMPYEGRDADEVLMRWHGGLR